MIRTFMNVFLHAPWYGAALMTVLFAGILVQLWWWIHPIVRRAKREPKWLRRAVGVSVVFVIVFTYYYDQMPKITSQQ